MIKMAPRDMDFDELIDFRDQFRNGRAIAQADAEGFQELLFVLERFGMMRYGEILSLGGYCTKISECAKQSTLEKTLQETFLEPNETWYRQWYTPFEVLYEAVRNARNDAMHQGAQARHLTQTLIQMAVILEDALMEEAKTKKASSCQEDSTDKTESTSSGNANADKKSLQLCDVMVRNVSVAQPWQPVSFVRQQMLSNSFTFIPIWQEWEENTTKHEEWRLLSDYHIAKYLQVSCAPEKVEDEKKRNKREEA